MDEPLSFPDDLSLCHQLLAEQSALVAQLRHEMSLLKRAVYGPRRERVPDDHPRLPGFEDESHEPGSANGSQDDTETVVREHRRRGHGRRPLPEDLPRERVEHEVPPEQIACPECGHDRSKNGESISEQLEYEPPRWYVIEHVQPKLVCRRCQGHHTTAPKPPQPIERGLPGPKLLAYVAVSKFVDHLPLHRVSRMAARDGIDLPESTLGDWVRQMAERFQPLYELMKLRLPAARLIQADETIVPVLDRKKKRTHQGYLWCYRSDDTQPMVWFEYQPGRGRAGPEKVLSDFRGILQSDGYAVYESICNQSGGTIVPAGCWAHARRKFFEARESDPYALEAIARIKQLFAVERQLRETQESDPQPLEDYWQKRREVRCKQTAPLLDKFHVWLNQVKIRAVPKSPMRAAINYVLPRWDEMTRFVDEGIVEIDNNLCENALRPFVVGRKNWLFAGSDRGARSAAILYSLVATCRRNGLDPYAYLRDTLTALPTCEPDHLTELLPLSR